MTLSELVEVNQVEKTIEAKQRELLQLYVTRATLMKRSLSYTQKQLENPTKLELMAQTMYEELSLKLAGLGLRAPAFRIVKRRLIRARTVMDDLESAWPDSIGSFRTILLPPSKLVPLPLDKKWRKAQYKRSKDVYDDSFRMPTFHLPARRNWGVMVISANPKGLYRGEPQMIISEQLYEVNGHDTRALGIEEYAILSLYLEKPIDTASRTMLLKNYAPNQPVQVVHYNGTHYVFEDDDSGMLGLFSDEGYRPAVLIR